MVNTAAWLAPYFERIAVSSPEGNEAVEYVRTHNIKVGIRRARKSVGAFWTLGRRIYLNSIYYNPQSILNDPRAWTIFIHEVRHLQQGTVTAMSIYGELDAWQYEFRIYKRIIGKELKPILEEMLTLPLNYDRDNLRYGCQIMSRHAGKQYGAGLLPLYPITKEIWYWFTGK